MKKFIYIVGILLSTLLFSNDVKAAELFRCRYTVNFNQIIPAAKDTNIEMYGVVTDEKKASFSSFDDLNGTDSLGGFYVAKQSGFDKLYNEEAKKQNTCPNIVFSSDASANTISLLMPTATPGEISMQAKGEVVSSNVENGEIVEYCTKTSRLRSSGSKLYITFYKEGTQNKWKISVDDGAETEATIDGVIGLSIDGFSKTFVLNDDVKEEYYKGDCSSKTMFLQSPDNDSSGMLITIQISKPSASENAAYGANQAEYDSGHHYEDNNNPSNDDVDYSSGCDMLGSKTIKFINKIYNYFIWIVPLLVIVYSIVDFIKVVALGDAEIYKKAQKNLIKRIVVGIVFFLVPMLVKLLINITGVTETFTDGDSIINTISCVFK